MNAKRAGIEYNQYFNNIVHTITFSSVHQDIKKLFRTSIVLEKQHTVYFRHHCTILETLCLVSSIDNMYESTVTWRTWV
jgi:hypothetical protein